MAGAQDAHYEAAVSHLYEMTLEPGRIEAALAAIVRLFDASGGLVWKVDADTGNLAYCHALGHEPAALRAYRDHYYKVDPSLKAGATLRPGQWLADDRALDPGEPSHREYLIDFCLVHDVRWIGGVKVLDASDGKVYLAVQRPPDHRAFGAEGHRWMQRLFPHVNRAVRLSEHLGRLTHGERLATTVLDRLGAAACVLDAGARVTMLNARGERFFSGCAPLRVRAGTLCADAPRTAQLLHEALRRACARPPRGGAFRAAPAGDDDALQVRVVPVPVGAPLRDSQPQPLALLLADATARSTQDVDVLRALFDLTPTEGRLLAALAAGRTVAQIRADNGVSINTLRSQLSALFDKTGANCQAQLVALARTLPAMRD